MNKPLFEVGEEVILCSINKPEKNGDAVVLSCGHKAITRNVHTREILRDVFCYKLTIQGDQGGCNWLESTLRKRHKPSDNSFEEMMSNLDRVVDTSDNT